MNPETTIGSASGINCTPFTAKTVTSGVRLYAVPDTVIGFAPGTSGLASTKNDKARVSGIPDIVRIALLAIKAVSWRARL